MKLINFTHKSDYKFILFFANGKSKETDLKELIEKYVSTEQLKTAQLNTEWGCLEFNDGRVDIEPNTLYNYAYGIRKVSDAA